MVHVWLCVCVCVRAWVHVTKIWTEQSEQTFGTAVVAIIVLACYITRRQTQILRALGSFKIYFQLLTHICWTIRTEIRFIGASGQHTKTDKPRSIESCARVRDFTWKSAGYFPCINCSCPISS